eukprot:101312_1
MNVKHIINQINIPDPTPFTPDVPPNNDIIMNHVVNKIFNDIPMIIPVNNITNDFNEFSHNIINVSERNKFNTVINNGSDDFSKINDGQIDTGFDDGRNVTVLLLMMNHYQLIIMLDNTITFDDSSNDNDIQMLDISQSKNAKGRAHGRRKRKGKVVFF